MRTYIILLTGLLLSVGIRAGYAQSHAPDTLLSHPLLRPRPVQPMAADSNAAATLGAALHQGHFGAHVRTVFMATANHRVPGHTYYAQGVGAGLRYETKAWHHLQVGLEGFFLKNLYSSQLAKDSARAESRYELSLFDIENPRNRALLHQVEELWVAWQPTPGLRLVYGRQHLDTPLLNSQDSRLSPNIVQGLWAIATLRPATTLRGGWLTHVAPRSTDRWFRLAESVGRYGMGVAPDSSAAGYAGAVHTRGLAVLGLRQALHPHAAVQLWQYYADHLLATTYAEGTASLPRPAGVWTAGGQLLWQRALAPEGRPNTGQRYLADGEQARALSLRLTHQHGPWQLAGQYTRVTAHGRFLFPREWGREPFYTTLPRERLEGAGDVHAGSATASWQRSRHARLELGYGYYNLSSQARLNKYSIPDFHQLNLSVSQAFGEAAEGLRLRALYVAKWGVSRAAYVPERTVNKVDLHHLTLAMDYEF